MSYLHDLLPALNSPPVTDILWWLFKTVWSSFHCSLHAAGMCLTRTLRAVYFAKTFSAFATDWRTQPLVCGRGLGCRWSLLFFVRSKPALCWLIAVRCSPSTTIRCSSKCLLRLLLTTRTRPQQVLLNHCSLLGFSHPVGLWTALLLFLKFQPLSQLQHPHFTRSMVAVNQRATSSSFHQW